MSKITKAKAHLSSEQILQKIKNTKGFWRVQKWLVIFNALNYPRKSEDIAKHLAVSKSFVNKTISEYNRFGMKAIETQGKGGRRNSYLSVEEEQQFMSQFIEDAKKGHVATAAMIKIAFENIVGHKVNKTTIYRLLERTGWRKIVPLPHHPKKDIGKQEAFKKLQK